MSGHPKSRARIVVETSGQWTYHLLPPVQLDEEPTVRTYVASDEALVATELVRPPGSGR